MAICKYRSHTDTLKNTNCVALNWAIYAILSAENREKKIENKLWRVVLIMNGQRKKWCVQNAQIFWPNGVLREVMQ